MWTLDIHSLLSRSILKINQYIDKRTYIYVYQSINKEKKKEESTGVCVKDALAELQIS
jgi:hypothetical protein